jgi:hypothetical protein
LLDALSMALRWDGKQLGAIIRTILAKRESIEHSILFFVSCWDQLDVLRQALWLRVAFRAEELGWFVRVAVLEIRHNPPATPFHHPKQSHPPRIMMEPSFK